MWNELKNETDIVRFMDSIYWFHDSCIKEMRYISGAYVNEKMSMWPINSKNTLSVVMHRQFRDMPAVELEFCGIKYLRLDPVDEGYTCEILGCSMFYEDGLICWCDIDGVTDAAGAKNADCTAICAKSARWRKLDGFIGETGFYIRADNG